MKKHFISFGSPKFYGTLERIKNEALNSGFFDIVNVFTEKDIPEFMEQHRDFIHNNSRGFGYYLWKSYFIKKYLSTISEGDILFYLDAGCSVNKNGKARFEEYVQICLESPFKNISFQYDRDENLEYKYTKGDLFEYLKTNTNDMNSGQILSGVIILQKCDFTVNLINSCYDTSCIYNLIDDSPSKYPNHPQFIEHRHDQSVFSLLRKSLGTYIIKNEIDTGDVNVNGKYINVHSYCPFIASRLKY
jgi:hypothetical protein